MYQARNIMILDIQRAGIEPGPLEPQASEIPLDHGGRSALIIPDVAHCHDTQCKDDSHKTQLDVWYHQICAALRSSSLNSIAKCKQVSATNYVVPGWNDLVKEQHLDARNSYVLWRNLGKPRHGPVFDTMSRSRLQFKYSLRQCRAMEDTARADGMAKSLQTKDTYKFWQSVKRH